MASTPAASKHAAERNASKGSRNVRMPRRISARHKWSAPDGSGGGSKPAPGAAPTAASVATYVSREAAMTCGSFASFATSRGCAAARGAKPVRTVISVPRLGDKASRRAAGRTVGDSAEPDSECAEKRARAELGARVFGTLADNASDFAAVVLGASRRLGQPRIVPGVGGRNLRT